MKRAGIAPSNRSQNERAIEPATRIPSSTKRPTLWSLVISGGVFVNNEFVVPYTERRKIEIKDMIRGRPARSVFRQSGIWYYGENSRIINIRLLDPAEERLEGITVYQFDPTHTKLLERIDARRAVFRDGDWHFREGTVRTFAEDGGITTFDCDNGG